MALNSIDHRRGCWNVLGALLSPLGAAYGAVTRVRCRAYRQGWLGSTAAGVPVISVGNITAGGTGKTPMVQLLAGWLREEGLKPAVLTRGYGGRRNGGVLVLDGNSRPDPATAGDEPCLLARNLRTVPVLVSPDRVSAARMAVEELGVDLLLLDDGFQHLRLRRDLDLLLVDASVPLAGNRVIPAGTLREPLPAMGRADAVICTRTPADGIPAGLVQLVAAHCPGRPLFAARHLPAGLTPLGTAAPSSRAIGAARGHLLVSGIGNPGSFRQTAEAFGLDVAGELAFADHHRFTRADIEAIGRRMATTGAEAVLLTEKDAVRLGPLAEELQWPAGFLAVRMAVEDEDRLRRLVAGLART